MIEFWDYFLILGLFMVLERFKKVEFSSDRNNVILDLGIIALFFILALLIMPVKQNFLFDTDEGQELIKALLYSQGFALYDPIWSDQPPLLTIILSSWFNLFGKSILSARLLILGLSAISIWSFFKILQICVGNLAALAGTLMLSLSCNFLRLSVSVMIGLPSMTFAILSIYTLILYLKDPRIWFLIVSGAAFAISLQFKMVSVFLIPLILFLSLKNPIEKIKYGKLSFRDFIPPLAWLASLATLFLLIGFAFNSLNLDSVFKFHVTNSLKNVFVRENSLADVTLFFLQDFDYFLLAIIGIPIAVKKQEFIHQFPLLWLATATLILLNHKPIWYHHYLLLSIPITWLASYGIALVTSSLDKTFKFRKVRRSHQARIAIALCILALVAVPIKLYVIQWQNQVFLRESSHKFAVVQNIVKYRPQTHWIFTDNPAYGFYANLPVPPEIAVLSRKRVASGEVTQEYLDVLLRKYQPEQVILERFPEVSEPIRPYLEEHYSKIDEFGSTRHYVLGSLVTPPGPDGNL